MKIAVLSSGGLDSTTCISLALDMYNKEDVCSIAFRYGQKHNKELECSEKIAQYYGIKHHVLDLTEIFKESKCSLISESVEIEDGSYKKQIENSNGIISTYVPFRNGLMLASVASFMMSKYDEEIVLYLGIHADDAAGNAYADCSEAFYESMNKAISIGTYNKVRIEAPFKSIHKSDIVAIGTKLKTPYELTWSCYKGGDRPCRTCATCIDRIKAFEVNGLVDPTLI